MLEIRKNETKKGKRERVSCLKVTLDKRMQSFSHKVTFSKLHMLFLPEIILIKYSVERTVDS